MVILNTTCKYIFISHVCWAADETISKPHKINQYERCESECKPEDKLDIMKEQNFILLCSHDHCVYFTVLTPFYCNCFIVRFSLIESLCASASLLLNVVQLALVSLWGSSKGSADAWPQSKRSHREEIPLSVIQEGGTAFLALPGPWGLRRRAQCTIFHREAGASACLCLVQSQRAKSEFLLCLYWLHDLFFFF